MQTKVRFGTSGLRGPADAFTPPIVAAHVGGFLEACSAGHRGAVLVGWDLRQSSPQIAALVAGAIVASGCRPVLAGPVPTPALAAYGIGRGVPGIMVTGSHIPAAHNGLKFHTAKGEALKSDEAAIASAAAAISEQKAQPRPAPLDPLVPDIAQAYRARYRNGFGPDALSGLKIGVFEHSAVGRDLLADIAAALGAGIVRFGRSERFVAVDTEAVEPDHLALCRNEIARSGLDAVVSTDGDGDRPLVLDNQGRQIGGDVLGALTARALGADTLVTPLTSTTAIERSDWFETVVRTRVGSPHVIEAMAGATGRTIVGFEANGGFLTGSDLVLGAGTLSALPTRDAVLPILAVLAEARKRRCAIGALAEQLPSRITVADRLKDIDPVAVASLLDALAGSASARRALDPRLEHPGEIDLVDGVRLALADGAIVHFRASGNAPELRCYVEAERAVRGRALLAEMMNALASQLNRKGRQQ